MGGVYVIINTVSGGVYVGQSSALKKRWLAHKSKLRTQHHCCSHLQAAWNKYGADAFVFETLEECGADQLTEVEQRWMDYLRFLGLRLYNAVPAAGSNRGFRQSQEAKQKMGAAKKGIVFSEAHRQALSTARRKRVVSEETKQKISTANLRRAKPSEETRQRTSETLKGHVVSQETRNKIAEKLRGRTLSDAHKAKVSAGVRKARAKTESA